MDSTKQALAITLAILALFGLFALLEALADRRAWRRREQAERARTTGVLVGYAEKQHRQRSGRRRPKPTTYVTVYYPIVRFRADGVEYTLESADTVPRAQFPEGQPVDLLYDPDAPAHFHLDRGDTQERSARGTVIFALAWVACVLAAIVLLLAADPQLGAQLKRTLRDATAPLRSR